MAFTKLDLAAVLPHSKRRMRDRKTDPLKQWKISPIDDQAIKRWRAYSRARDEMLARSHSPTTPCALVRADDKRLARLNIIGDLLGRLHYAGKDERLTRPDPKIVFASMARTPRTEGWQSEGPRVEVSGRRPHK